MKDLTRFAKKKDGKDGFAKKKRMEKIGVGLRSIQP
jgi:hypothetical protein